MAGWEDVAVSMLPRQLRLSKREDFKRVFQFGKSVANREFVCYTLHNPEVERFRMGVSVSKRIGNAVVRNRVKRLIREVVRIQEEQIPDHLDLVIIARSPARHLDFHGVKRSLNHLFWKGKILRQRENRS